MDYTITLHGRRFSPSVKPKFLISASHPISLTQAVSILGNPLQASAQSEENGCTATTETTATAVDKATARTAATQAARVPDELLRALGAKGRGLDSGGRPYGLALLKVVEDVATEAFARGDRSRGKIGTCICKGLHPSSNTSGFMP